MPIRTMKSEEARRGWRDMLDNVFMGGASFIIERNSKPLAILVNFDEWQRMKEIEADRINGTIQEMRAGNYISGEEIDRVLGA